MASKLTISQLIAAHGDEKIELQNLDQCANSIDYHHKKGITITFGTTARLSKVPSTGMEKLGLVIWLDRGKVDEILARSKEQSHD